MQTLVSNSCSSFQSTVPESYELPPERRPTAAPPCKTIPVIDLQQLDRDRTDLIQQIIKASQEYGFFQLSNHGVSEELMRDVLMVGKEFFDLLAEEKERFYYRDPKQICKFKTSINYEQEGFISGERISHTLATLWRIISTIVHKTQHGTGINYNDIVGCEDERKSNIDDSDGGQANFNGWTPYVGLAR